MENSGFMIAAPSSNSGKTVVSCALMAAFSQLNKRVCAAKCGPDYIDPMFHREVLGVESVNLDLFFSDKEELQELYHSHIADSDVSIVEGVMGYYDGTEFGKCDGSAYEIAKVLDLPVILVFPCRGMGVSAAALLKGILEFREDHNIRGIILNRVSKGLYPRMKQMIESELARMGHGHIRIVGYIPENEVFRLESRHLGLVTPMELKKIQEQMQAAGTLIRECVDLEEILRIAGKKAFEKPKCRKEQPGHRVRIAVAKDEAFCFYYKENLRCLQSLGCEMVPFSPIRDRCLPEGCSGLILGGGYPELYAKQLSENHSLTAEIRDRLKMGVPCLAECGGFLYLLDSMESQEGISYPMVGVFEGTSENKGKLTRFGYVSVRAVEDGAFLKKGEVIRGHEFHHWDSSNNGNDCLAVKPDQTRRWDCIHMQGNIMAGFPHLYYPSNRRLIERFVRVCDMVNKKER